MEHVARVTAALNFIERNLRDDLRVDDIASAAGYSTSHFHSLFASVTGRTVADYVRARRLACAALNLAFSQKRLIDIAFEYRFESQEAFTRAFKRVYGVTPGEFRRGPQYTDIVTRVGIHRTMDEIRRRLAGDGHDRAAGLTPSQALPESGSGQPLSQIRTCSDGPSPTTARRVLAGVPRVGFFNGGDQCPEDITFPSCLAAALRYMGEDYPWIPVHQHRTDWRLNGAYVEIMAATGMAFGLLWRDGWHEDNADLMFIADPREVVRRAFEQAGYAYDILQKRGEASDADVFRERICSSLDRGRPVLAFGVIGPPECCLVTGYDDGGEVLVGWNYFQDENPLAQQVGSEPNGCFRRRDWFNDTVSAVVIGEKIPGAGNNNRLRRTLEWAISVAATPQVYGRHSGFRAYDAWAAHLLDDSAFATGDVDLLRQRHRVHEVAVSNVVECRWYAHMYLRQVVKAEAAMAADLEAAAAEFDREHTLMWQVWNAIGGNGYPQAHLRLAEPDTRRQLASIIRTARECDERAVGHLEKALRK